MDTQRVLVDSDILISILRRDRTMRVYAREQISVFGFISISAVTYYEVQRGLLSGNAPAQQQQMIQLKPQLRIWPVSEVVANQAAILYDDLRTQGRLLPDADLLIAATALVHNLSLASNNQRHYARIPALSLANWDV